jgi:hypothetical protein
LAANATFHQLSALLRRHLVRHEPFALVPSGNTVGQMWDVRSFDLSGRVISAPSDAID